jgi:transposase InsO family protein
VAGGRDVSPAGRPAGPVGVFVAVDHCTLECVRLHAAKRATRFEALEPIRQAVRASFGRYEAGVAAGAAVRHDHGSAYLSAVFQDELAFLGIASSPAFVREPEGNGVAEWFIKMLKQNLLWLEPFATVADLQAALAAFKRRYNEEWLIERHGYRTPSQVRRDFLARQERAA